MKQQADQSGTPESKFLLERRQFLMLSSAAIVGLAATDLSASVLGIGADAALPASLAIAYADGMDSARVEGTRLLDAQSIPTGDPRFLSHAADVRVLGLWRAEANRSKPLSLTVVAYYPTELTLGGERTVLRLQLHAEHPHSWSVLTDAFHIPVDDAGLRLGIESGVPLSATPLASLRRRVAGPVAEAGTLMNRSELAKTPNIASLTLGHEGNAMKLQAGTYVVALLPNGASAPNWSSMNLTMADRKTANGPLSVPGILGNGSAPFDYLILSIDFVG